MLPQKRTFDLNGRKLRRGAFSSERRRARLEPMLRDLGLSAWAVASVPREDARDDDSAHRYVHSWSRTQDEGWVRAALDHYGVPYTYFADQKLRQGGLRQKYDVIIFPHVGGTSQSQIAGIARTGTVPVPYKKTADTPNLGGIDESDDIRGGMGFEGLQELAKFVQEGGALITEGVDHHVAGGIRVGERCDGGASRNLFARGSILRGVMGDLKSPIAYGYDNKDLRSISTRTRC
jgi:hypothetical protein